MAGDEYAFLGQLFGPKGENEDLLLKLATTVLLDYTYWRKNYFPDDPLVLTSEMRRTYDDERDTLVEATNSLVAHLRRSFPFYSPRYIAHQQSETSIASLIGAFAGTIYNSNNVTPESGIATVEMEIDACNELLKLIGFLPMPEPPTKVEALPRYKSLLGNNFGWCHLTSGGTVANIEALWVARVVKFFPLAVRDICRRKRIDLQVALPHPETRVVQVPQSQGQPSTNTRVLTVDIRTLTDTEVLGLRPMEAIFLLGRLTQALAVRRRPPGMKRLTLSDYVWEILDKSNFSPRHGISSYGAFKPRIFVSGAAHYSIKKAADILGLGKNAVIPVLHDSRFRINIDDLRKKMKEERDAGCCILAVVAIAGTTEEGAVDPVHKVVALRDEWERTYNESFWIHVDAAWGGFFRTLLLDDNQQLYLTKDRLVERLALLHREVLRNPPFSVRMPNGPDEEDAAYWLQKLIECLKDRVSQHNLGAPPPNFPMPQAIERYFATAEERGDYTNVLHNVETILDGFSMATTGTSWEGRASYFKERRVKDTLDATQAFTTITASLSDDRRAPRLSWPHHPSVGRAMLAIEETDSVAIDPHKMGYAVYPNGAVAFRSDAVRHFIRHEAPYITSRDAHSSSQAPDEDLPPRERPGGHYPIRYATEKDGELKVTTEAFAQYTLEGSRPSAAACSLWLSIKSLPLCRGGHGRLIRSSALAARLMYQYMVYWKEHKYGRKNERGRRGDRKYEFVFFSDSPPDTNIVVFGVKPAGQQVSLHDFNTLNKLVYRRFSILSEHGERGHSYSQPFFLSHTLFKPPSYPHSTLAEFFGRYSIDADEVSYSQAGIFVLRATVMNPYLLPMQPKMDLIYDFMKALDRETLDALAAMEAAQRKPPRRPKKTAPKG